MTIFLVITVSNMVICVIYCHQLPFYLISRGAPHQIQPHFFASFQQKCLEKIFSVALRGAPAPPGYIYDYAISNCRNNNKANGMCLTLTDGLGPQSVKDAAFIGLIDVVQSVGVVDE